jgi:hypothetical protein
MLTHQRLAKDVLTISNFFSPEECDYYVQLSEALGYEDAPISTQRGMIIRKDVRNNDRVMLDDANRANDLWHRVREFLP